MVPPTMVLTKVRTQTDLRSHLTQKSPMGRRIRTIRNQKESIIDKQGSDDGAGDKNDETDAAGESDDQGLNEPGDKNVEITAMCPHIGDVGMCSVLRWARNDADRQRRRRISHL